MKNIAIAAISAVTILIHQSSMAVPTTIIDTTPGSAVNDGTVNLGEYVGFSAGINSGFGNVIGSSSQMHIDSSSGGALNVGFIFGGGGFNDMIVIYIDSVAGGFSSTATFNDQQDDHRRGISAKSGSGASDVTFATGFEADYALAINNSFAGLWQLASGGNGSLIFVANANLNQSAGQAEVDITLANIGLSPGGAFNYVATYLNQGNSFRSDEFHGVAQSTANSGNIGQNPIILADGDFNTFRTIPEPSTMAMAAFGMLGLALHRIRCRK